MNIGQSMKIPQPQPERSYNKQNPLLTDLTAQWDKIVSTNNNFNEYYKYRDARNYMVIFSILTSLRRKLRTRQRF